MRIQREYIYNHLGLPRYATKATSGNVAKALKKTADKAVEFAEAPFKSKVVVYETAEDHLE
tara:strand:- start:134 stop:316 length:183 start_codon:yes stop_codon:yes gene_type:complete